MKEEHFKFKKRYYSLIKEMTDKQAGEFIKGVCAYVFFGKVPCTKDKFLKGAYLMFQNDFKEQKRNEINGRKGGIISAELRGKKESAITVISMSQETICPASEFLKTIIEEKKKEGESVAKNEKK